MLTTLYTIYLLFILSVLYYCQKKHINFNKRVFLSLILGGLTGTVMHYLHSPQEIDKIMNIYKIISEGYTRFLQMLVYPIVVIATLTAMTKVGEKSSTGKSLTLIISILLITTAISAVVGIIVANFTHLDLSTLSTLGASHSEALTNLNNKKNILNSPIYQQITDFITTNPFADLTGSRPNSIASLVIFCIILGTAYLGVKRKKPEIAEKFKSAVEVSYTMFMRVVTLVLRLTPYGIFAIFCKITATTDVKSLLSLLSFVGASYLAIIIMFIIHLILLMIFKINVLLYIKKVFPLLSFSFVSRSSVASIPFNIQTQTEKLGVNESTASLSASFGAILGQNGCAGIYPSMLAIIVAPMVGINPMDIYFLISLVIIVTVSSFGIAGIGGGATFAALAVLGTFNMPITIVILLLGIEPLIDMARTALNVSGSLTSSLITSQMLNTLDKSIMKDPNVTISEE